MTTPDRRDRALESWLARAGGESAGTTDDCLDAEAAAAWLDDGLAPEARRAAEAHVADCARCQLLIASLTRAIETEAAGTAPSLAAPGWSRRSLWSASLAAAAVAVLAAFVWTRMPGHSQTAGTALARVEEKAAREMRAPSPEANPTARADAVPRAAQGAVTTQSEAGATGAAAGPASGGIAPGQVEERVAAEARDSSAPPTASSRAEQAPPVPPSDSAPPTPALSEALSEPAPSNPALSKAAPAAPQPSPSVQGQAPAVPGEPRTFARQAFVDQIASPDSNNRWRIRGSAVERSVDGGGTWTATQLAGDGPLTAGSSPGGAVCWVVGRSGAVFVSRDGVTWVRRSLSPPADLVGVVATSAESAVVTTVDGRRWATTDGGITWVPAER